MSKDEKKLFTDRRWTDPMKATVIGRVETSEEERKKDREMFLKRLREKGVIKE